MSGRLDWSRDGLDWPNRGASRFVHAAGLRWHVQRLGAGPTMLLLHGTGASTHSWRDLAPLLARSFDVVAPDLPGHGFTDMPVPHRLSLDGIAGDVGQLLTAIEARPDLVVGHSAGAAILLAMCLDGRIAPRQVVSVNGALLPFRGMPGRIFTPLAKMLAGTSFVPQWFARRAENPRVVRNLLDSTGSRLDPAGAEYYRRLARNPGHVAGALAMMAHWNLPSLAAALPKLQVPLALVVGGNDGTVPATEAFRVRDLVPNATVHYLKGLGHLAHEEQPQQIADLLLQLWRGVAPVQGINVHVQD